MTLDEAQSQLLSQYQIEHFINLTDFDSNGKGRLYNRLRKARKDAFADNERIVVIAVDPLTRTYSDQPPDVLAILEQHVQHHDIPHFFIIVLSNIPAIDQDLEYVRSKYNPQEALPIKHQWID